MGGKMIARAKKKTNKALLGRQMNEDISESGGKKKYVKDKP
jgi:hypothetical protein